MKRIIIILLLVIFPLSLVHGRVDPTKTSENNITKNNHHDHVDGGELENGLNADLPSKSQSEEGSEK